MTPKRLSSPQALLKALQGQTRKSEQTTADIGLNRLSVLNELIEIRPDSIIALWLNDTVAGKGIYYLAYIAPYPAIADDKISLNNIIVEIDNQTPPHAPHEKSKNALSAKFLKVIKPHHRTTSLVTTEFIHRTIRRHNHEISTQEYPDIIGAITILSTSTDADWNEYEKCALAAKINTLSVLIEQSRIRRILHFRMQTDTIISTKSPVDQTLKQLADLLQISCSANAYAIYSAISGRYQLSASSKKWDNYKSIVDIQKIIKSHGDLDEPLKPFQEILHLDDPHRHRNTINTLVIPVYNSGFSTSKSPESLLYINNNLPREHINATYIVLVDKLSPYYLNQNFSGTDYRISTHLSSVLSEYFHSEFNNHAYSDISQRLWDIVEDERDQWNRTTSIPPQVIFNALETLLPQLSSIYTVIAPHIYANQADLSLSQYASDDNNDYALIRNLVLEDISHLRTRKKAKKIIQHVIILKYFTQNNDTLFIIRAYNENIPVRYLVLKLKQSKLEFYRFSLIKHFAREYALAQQALDLRTQINSMIGQIGHSITSPIALAHSKVGAIKNLLRATSKAPNPIKLLTDSKWGAEPLLIAEEKLEEASLFLQTGTYMINNIAPQTLRAIHYKPDNLVNEIVDQYRERARSHAMYFSTKMRAFKSSYVGDKPILGVILHNLIDNALKYGRNNSSIDIFVEHSGNESNWKFSISTVGDYLTPDDQERIFQLYTRASKSAGVARQFGTGIGLAFCAAGVLAHNQRAGIDEPLTVQSQLRHDGNATNTFSFSIPAQPFKDEA